jgi:hypothetical protein
MKDITSLHVQFAQLPVEARVLFSIFASAALARYRSQIPTSGDLAAGLESVWNANRLTLPDLSDPYRMTALLESRAVDLLADGEENGCFRKRRRKRGQ